MASGISIMMMTVERQLPRNSKIISPVNAAAMAPSRTTPVTAALTKGDWSPTVCRSSPAGNPASILGSRALTPAIMSKVEDEPAFRIDISTALAPLTRTMLVCGGEPSCA